MCVSWFNNFNMAVSNQAKSLFCIYAKLFAAIIFLSGAFLLYTAVIAPAQIFLWEIDEVECKTFPTLYFDLFVDAFFLVRLMLLYNATVQLR
jgi:hypothetical protein